MVGFVLIINLSKNIFRLENDGIIQKYCLFLNFRLLFLVYQKVRKVCI